jgi:hypothetical protein
MRDEDEEAQRETPERESLAQRLRRLPPVLLILGSSSAAILVLIAIAIAAHTTPIPILTAAAVVAGIIFALDTVVAGVATYQAGREGYTGRALLLALVGGCTALASSVSFAVAAIMALVTGI